MRSVAACLFAGFAFAAVMGCSSGGGGGPVGGGGEQSAITAVSVSCSPSAILTTQTSACTQFVSGSGSYSTTVSWLVSPTSAGSVSSSGVFTPTASGSATITATSTQDATKSGSATVTVSEPSAVTGVTVSVAPNAITTAQTAQATATVQGIGNFSTAVTWSVSPTAAGSISSAGLFTPAATGTATLTACSAEDGYTNICGSASVSITRATPTITSVTKLGQDWIACPAGCDKSSGTLIITGTGFSGSDNVSTNNYWATAPPSGVSADGTSMSIRVTFDGSQQPGWIAFQDQPTDGTPASNVVAIPYLPYTQNASYVSSTEITQDYLGTTYVWKLANGTWSLSESFSTGGTRTVATTAGGNHYFVSGFDYYTPSGTLAGGATMGIVINVMTDGDASGATACVTQPGENETAVYTVGPYAEQPVMAPTGTMPYDCQVYTTPGGTTYGVAASVDGTPGLWLMDANGNNVSSTNLTGIIGWSKTATGNGNWRTNVVKSGTYAGRIGFLSSYDQKLLIYDGTNTTLPAVADVSLAQSCTLPAALMSVDATGEFIVMCADNAHQDFYFVGFNPDGTPAAPITATTTVFPYGAVADQQNMYILQQASAPVTIPLQ